MRIGWQGLYEGERRWNGEEMVALEKEIDEWKIRQYLWNVCRKRPTGVVESGASRVWDLVGKVSSIGVGRGGDWQCGLR